MTDEERPAAAPEEPVGSEQLPEPAAARLRQALARLAEVDVWGVEPATRLRLEE